jgi:hypothetical protein
MSKPIFIISIPENSDVEKVVEYIIKEFDDYHVLFFVQDIKEFKFECFYAKDMTHVKFEKLKDIIKDKL